MGQTDKHLGSIDVPSLSLSTNAELDSSPLPEISPLSSCQNLDDIESAARKKLSRKAWIYYDSGADTLTSPRTNRDDWSKISFRPSAMRNVAKISMKRSFMDLNSILPFFIAPAAMASWDIQTASCV